MGVCMERSTVLKRCEEEVYFAAVNSSEGFLSFFSELFSPNDLDHVLILKGGPGTGKSTALRSIAADAEAVGERVVRFLCSSDPGSLDGVVIEGRKIGVLDGTAPHAMEATYPGVGEELFDAGAFWDTARLKEQRELLFALIRKKKEQYALGYHLLHVAGELYAERAALCCQSIKHEKLLSAARRQFRAFANEAEGSGEHRQVTAFCGQGTVELDTFLRLAKTRIVVTNRHACGEVYLDALRQLATESGISYQYSVEPLSPKSVRSLYFPMSQTLVYLGEEYEDYPVKTRVNLERFLDYESVRLHRNRLRFLDKCIDEISARSAQSFLQAQSLHATLESYYIKAMDFAALSKAWEKKKNALLQKTELK